jgi:peptidoglycan/LPS O-acetylase OafA/YrhL
MKNQESVKVSSRVDEIDFVRGLCVVGMVVHHSLDYFGGDLILAKNIRFISGAFVFLSGFLMSQVSFRKAEASGEYINSSRRMIFRGLRLLAVFTLVNLLVTVLGYSVKGGGEGGLAGVLSRLWAVYIEGSYTAAVFALLVPIAYIVILSGILLLILKKKIRWVVPLGILAAAVCSVLAFSQDRAFNARYLAIGLLGVSLGLIPPASLERLKKAWPIVALLYAGNLIAVYLLPLSYPLYCANIILTLALFYTIGLMLPLQAPGLQRTVNLLGRYSLFGYFAQIALLQIFARLVAQRALPVSGSLLAFCVVTLATMGAVLLLDFLLPRSKILTRLYKLAFA